VCPELNREHSRDIAEFKGVQPDLMRHGHCEQPSTGTQFLLLATGGSNNVVDNLRRSIGAVVGWAGIQLHSGWIHPFVPGNRPGHSDN
jgi:hypothetical protein